MVRHKNYKILNLIGYGLAKFDMSFVQEFGFQVKQRFFEYIVEVGVAETVGTVKNRQDLFDPLFAHNHRQGWRQTENKYIYREKVYIDSVLGSDNVQSYAKIVKLYLHKHFNARIELFESISPIIESKYRHLQVTGLKAELFFRDNYEKADIFKNGVLEDARIYGDGYDFQIKVNQVFFLIEVKGLKNNYGSIRFTEKEFRQAKKYEDAYVLVVVSQLEYVPKMHIFPNPTKILSFTKKVVTQEQVTYHSESLEW